MRFLYVAKILDFMRNGIVGYTWKCMEYALPDVIIIIVHEPPFS